MGLPPRHRESRSKWVFFPVILTAGQTGLPPRHCEEPQSKARGATKQSFNTIFARIIKKIAVKDCFVAPRTKALLLLAMTGMKTPVCSPDRKEAVE
jgi:hypothetical protein